MRSGEVSLLRFKFPLFMHGPQRIFKLTFFFFSFHRLWHLPRVLRLQLGARLLLHLHGARAGVELRLRLRVRRPGPGRRFRQEEHCWGEGGTEEVEVVKLIKFRVGREGR